MQDACTPVDETPVFSFVLLYGAAIKAPVIVACIYQGGEGKKGRVSD